ncbi:hypothetical protein ABT364_07905 [Massilia sp. SR12]
MPERLRRGLAGDGLAAPGRLRRALAGAGLAVRGRLRRGLAGDGLAVPGRLRRALAGAGLAVRGRLRRGLAGAGLAAQVCLRGALAWAGCARAGGGGLGRWDAHGLAGLTWLLLASAYWMVPRALEQALTLPLAELGKFASLFLAGFLLPAALARAAAAVQLFFLGNFCAMMAIAGMLYQDMPQRLCNAYTLDDQVITGVGLVVASIGIAAAWCIWQLPALGAYTGEESRNAR